MISRVGVIGAGPTGCEIAELCARAGLDVIMAEVCLATAETGRQRISCRLERAQRDGTLTQGGRVAAQQRIQITDDFARLSEREIVVEALTDDEHVQALMFARLDGIVANPDAILASSSLSVPIMRLGMATARPQQVIGLRLVRRAPALDLVELLPSLLTSAVTRQRAEEFAIHVAGHRAVRSRDPADSVLNALLVQYVLPAIRMVESGVASAEEIDGGMVRGCAHPIGPLKLADLIGLDTTKALAESFYAQFNEPFYSPPPLLSRMVEAGLLGRKSGEGFHEYAARHGA